MTLLAVAGLKREHKTDLVLNIYDITLGLDLPMLSILIINVTGMVFVFFYIFSFSKCKLSGKISNTIVNLLPQLLGRIACMQCTDAATTVASSVCL